MDTPRLDGIRKIARLGALPKAMIYGGAPGAAIGAGMDDDNRVRGAILGALTGTGIGYGISSGIEASEANKALFQKIRRAQRSIEDEQLGLMSEIEKLTKGNKSMGGRVSNLTGKYNALAETLDSMKEPEKTKTIFQRMFGG